MPTPRKVLLVSLFHPELIRGGAQQVCYELFEGLKEHEGVHPVLLASIDHATYPALYKSGARITGFDEREDQYLFLSSEYDYWWHKSANPLLIESFADFLQQIKPDVVHFHHFLTYGIDLLTLTRRVLPHAKIVFTLHEFLLICHADGHMVRKNDKTLCTKASQVRCHQCFPDHTPEDFFARKMWIQQHLQVVDVFTCPTKFMIQRYADWGIPQSKLVHVTNGQRNYAEGSTNELASPSDSHTKRNRFGFFGQMVDVKGIQIVLSAVQQLRSQGFTDFKVEINGSNLNYASALIRTEIEQFKDIEATLPFEKRIVQFNGQYSVNELPYRMSRVDWCIVPSVWWEIFALVISEAWMFKRPVICSNIGAMAERVKDGVDGLHFQVGNADSLMRTIKRACEEEGLYERLARGIAAPPSRGAMTDAFLNVYA